MRMVGSVALWGTPVPGVGVFPPAGDPSAAVRVKVRSVVYALAHLLVRVVSVAVRMRRPVVPLLTGRPRSVPLDGVQVMSGAPIPVPRSPSVLEDGAAPAAGGAHDRRHELVLPADPTAPRRARALLQTAAQEWSLDDDLLQDAAMVATELVANAVDHARTPSTFTVGLDDDGLHVTVRDGSPEQALRPRPVDPTAPRGRGLQMVDALAESWGVTVHGDGKTVWAVLRES